MLRAGLAARLNSVYENLVPQIVKNWRYLVEDRFPLHCSLYVLFNLSTLEERWNQDHSKAYGPLLIIKPQLEPLICSAIKDVRKAEQSVEAIFEKVKQLESNQGSESVEVRE